MRLPVFTDPVSKEPSFTITVAAITWAVVLVKWMMGGTTLLGHVFATVPESEVSNWLLPTLGFYLARQATKVK